MEYKRILNEINKFVKDRDWDQFHSPKNLAMALSVEASELVEIFQWQEKDDYKLEKFKKSLLSRFHAPTAQEQAILSGPKSADIP